MIGLTFHTNWPQIALVISERLYRNAMVLWTCFNIHNHTPITCKLFQITTQRTDTRNRAFVHASWLLKENDLICQILFVCVWLSSVSFVAVWYSLTVGVGARVNVLSENDICKKRIMINQMTLTMCMCKLKLWLKTLQHAS